MLCLDKLTVALKSVFIHLCIQPSAEHPSRTAKETKKNANTPPLKNLHSLKEDNTNGTVPKCKI